MIIIYIPGANAQQVMVTPTSYVEDQIGNVITYEEFVKRMNTGKFIPTFIKNDDGVNIGFRLTPKSAFKSAHHGIQNREISIQSTDINNAKTLQVIYRDYLFAPV